ncbi:MAG: hypothetical protein AB8F78_10580 [Saprospiraceae bacterium]
MDTREVNEHAFMEDWRLRLIAAADASNENGQETAEFLGISKSAYYRRRRGDMPFSAYEYVMLSRRFGLDMLPNKEAIPRFGFVAPMEADATFNETRYLSQLEASSQLFAKPEDVSVLVSTTDIPIFYLFGEPDLAALKRYLFGLAIDAKGARRFDLATARKTHGTFIGRTATVSRAYRSTQREEAWGPSPLRSLTYQILLLVEGSAIQREDCLALFEAIGRVIDRLEKSLNGGSEDEGPLKLWQNRLHATSSILQFTGPHANRLFVTFDNPNFFSTEDPKAIAYFSGHFEALRKRSLRIAGHGALSPARYAQQLRDYVALGIKKAERAYDEMEEEL